MKYRVISPTESNEKPLYRVLKNRNIKDLEKYLNTPKSYSISHTKLNNIDKSIQRIEQAFENGELIGLLVDCDVDGYTSAASFYKYIKEINNAVEIKLFFHQGKQHGLSYDVEDIIRESNIDLLVITDAGSNDFEKLEEFSEIMDIIIIDHHEVEKESEHAIVVNNQLSPNYKNKQLSGAGVTYRVCQAMDYYFGFEKPYADNLLDLVALGNIADGMNMNNLDVRYLAQVGMKNINNTLMQCIIQKQSRSMNNRINISSIGWSVAPMLNAVIRIGTQEEKEKLFKGFLSEDTDFCNEVVDMCIKVKRKQDAAVKKLVPILEDMIEDKELDKGKAIILEITGMGDREVIGLVANKLLNKYKRPVMLLHELTTDKDTIAGSVRCPREIPMFKSTCIKTEEFIFCEGHQNAFGCAIKRDNVDNAIIKLNNALKDIEIDLDPTYAVDMVIQYGGLKKSDVFEIGELADLWGNGVDEPLFLIKGIKMNSNNIRLAGKNNTIMFNKNDFSFVKFFTNAATWEEMTMGSGESREESKSVILDVVCKFKINEWNGVRKPQIEIIDFNVEEDELSFF